MTGSFGVIMAISLLTTAVAGYIRRMEDEGPFTWESSQYAMKETRETHTGYIEEYTNNDQFCQSRIIGPGFSLQSKTWLIILYAFILSYLFLGIAIVSDIFMESIEEITSQTELTIEVDSFGKEDVIEKTIWNPTVANLTLMALGSSAPEIMLAVLETVINLEGEPQELGPNTIVGSAAFNLLVISAVSIVSVDEIKKIDDLGVFTITSISSVLAYVWMLVVLTIWTPNEVTIIEALLTLIYFGLLIAFSYAADRYRQEQKARDRTVEDQEELDKENEKQSSKAFLRREAEEHGKKYVIDCVTNGIHALKATAEQKEKIQKHYRKAKAVQNIDELSPEDLIQVLEAENLIERLKFRGKGKDGGNKMFKMKGSRLQQEHGITDQGNLNPKIGFKSTKYSVTESSGHVEITIVKKVAEEMAFLIKTEDDTATSPEDYDAYNEVYTMGKNEKEYKINIKIEDDDIWEPDKDFFVHLCSEDGQRMDGNDTKCTVTILDEDNPGVIAFEKKHIKVRKMDQYAYIRVVRQDGSDGDVKCMVQTRMITDAPNAAKEFEDFLPEERVLAFKHSEQETLVQIQLNQTANVPDGANSAINENSHDSTTKKGKDADGSDSSSEMQEDETKVFQVVLDRPMPEGVRIARQNVCFVEIVGNDNQIVAADETQQKWIDYLLEQKDIGWLQQFKVAVMLGPTIDEDNNIEHPEGSEAIYHFLAMGWKIFFSMIPPRRYGNGLWAFLISLFFIGVVTAVVSEFANLFGCVLDIKQPVTAITFVALGTSLPDTFASRTAAIQSEFADSAIGNITGSNSVNVFLGLGLPWAIASIYNRIDKGIPYHVKTSSLGFSVTLFLCTSVVAFSILALRRWKLGGELGGPPLTKWLSAGILVLLWMFYICMSTLQTQGLIDGF